MGPDSTVFVMFFAFALFIIVFMWFTTGDPRTSPRRGRRRCLEPYATPYHVPHERFESGTPPPTSTPDLQAAIDFSDITVPVADHASQATTSADAAQLQTIDERFREAKRSVAEHKLKNGVYTSAQRRKLVEALLRRPPCGRRVRSWRTENSDYIRGDVVPRAQGQSTNLVRSAKNNPNVDLHPGALGPMAGMQGQWLSEENIPENLFEDTAIFA